MDYTTQPFAFKAKKAVRYTRLYGMSRTLAKVRSHYHMKRRYDSLPAVDRSVGGGRHVGILGCGKFAYATIAHFLARRHARVIRAAMDVDVDRAASLFERYGLAYYTDDAAEVIADPEIDLLYIASNHASHAEYAIEALDRGKSVHIEKPHVVSEDQLERLCAAMERSSGSVALGFNRPHSDIGRRIKAHLDAQRGAAMLNWFVAGHEIPPDHWYYAEEEGGRVLGNLCHWTDFVYQLIPAEQRFPVKITPTRGAQEDTDIAVTYTFADDSIAAITFSAKGHTFEGIRERFAGQRGDALITMDDFKTLEVQVVDDLHRTRHRFRDHGHERNILESYRVARGEAPGCSPAYVWETGQLFLKTREALRAERSLVVEGFEGSLVAPAGAAA